MAFSDENPSLYQVKFSKVANAATRLDLVPYDSTRRVLYIISDNIGGLAANSYLFLQNDPTKIFLPFIGNQQIRVNFTEDYAAVCQAFGVTIGATNGNIYITEVCTSVSSYRGNIDANGIIKKLSAKLQSLGISNGSSGKRISGNCAG